MHKLRAGGYATAGDQLDALWKIVAAIMVHLPAEARAAIPAEALAELEAWAAVKDRFPKKPPRKRADPT